MKIIDKIISEDKLSAKVLQATDDNFVIETGVFDDGNTSTYVFLVKLDVLYHVKCVIME